MDNLDGSAFYLFEFTLFRGILLTFLVLNSTLALLFASMIDSGKLAVFLVPSVERGWDSNEKASACRRAGLLFVFLAVLALFAPLLNRLQGPYRVLSSRVRHLAYQGYCRFVPNVQRRRSGCKDSDNDTEMPGL